MINREQRERTNKNRGGGEEETQSEVKSKKKRAKKEKDIQEERRAWWNTTLNPRQMMQNVKDVANVSTMARGQRTGLVLVYEVRRKKTSMVMKMQTGKGEEEDQHGRLNDQKEYEQSAEMKAKNKEEIVKKTNWFQKKSDEKLTMKTVIINQDHWSMPEITYW